MLSVISREMLRQYIKQIAEAMHKDVQPSQGQDHTCRDFVWVSPRAHLGVVATCGKRYFALSSTSDGDLPRNRVQSHFMADIEATNLMTSECSLSRRPIQLNYSIVQTSVIVYNDTQIYLNLNFLIDDSSQAGSSPWPHRLHHDDHLSGLSRASVL